MLMSFLGILTFSLAGVLMRKSKLQNFSFAPVAFFGGLYFLFDTLNYYMPLIIDNPQNRTPTHLAHISALKTLKKEFQQCATAMLSLKARQAKELYLQLKFLKTQRRINYENTCSR